MRSRSSPLPNPAALASISLMHRYETRLHLIYQRALHNLLLLRAADPQNSYTPNEPNPISGHSSEILLLPAPANHPKMDPK
jgi:hypothetical protein